ncbi:MAG TPA: carbonic anhydrase [Solirubrobacterales bacterium]|nr:carbonic anhydrase [Solirubrobacterales bacterium]
MEPAEHPETPAEALRALRAGNERHLAGERGLRSHSPLGGRHEEGQRPFAAIITCADSRVSPALVFDLDRGNLFVSRIAGNSIDTGTLGSTEYAVAELGVKLVVVLGHSDCGAVKAAIEVANGTQGYPADEYGSIGAVVDAIVPSVESLTVDQRTVPNCIEANARAQARELAGKAPIIRPAVDSGTLRVVAAVCDVESGRVELV